MPSSGPSKEGVSKVYEVAMIKKITRIEMNMILKDVYDFDSKLR